MITQLFQNHVCAVLDRFELPNHDSFQVLCAMIAAHESAGFNYIQQRGGPANGVLQFEEIAVREALRYMGVKLMSGNKVFYCVADYIDWIVAGKNSVRESSIIHEHLTFDTDLSIALCRVIMMSKPEPFPEPDDLEGLADYAKRHWNSAAGKATPEKYLNDYLLLT